MPNLTLLSNISRISTTFGIDIFIEGIVPSDPLEGSPIELVTEDGVFIVTEDQIYIGVE